MMASTSRWIPLCVQPVMTLVRRALAPELTRASPVLTGISKMKNKCAKRVTLAVGSVKALQL